MNTKTFKIVSTILMAIFVLATISQVALATTNDLPTTAAGVLDKIQPDTDNVNAGALQTLASRILGLIQIASAVASLVLISVFGFKFIMGSANEKVDIQKSFIPLIIGVVVVFASSSIAKLLFSTFTGIDTAE